MNTYFIGIGAHKAGTNWLYVNLQNHPDIWLPPRKEIHYFARRRIYPSPSYLDCSRNLLRRFLLPKNSDREYQIELIKSLYSLLKKPSVECFKWYLFYYFGEHDFEWYLNLLSRDVEKVTGEITPAYSMLNVADVESVYRILPNAKIIFLLRNPIDRTWSAIRYRKKRSHGREDLTDTPVNQLSAIVNSKGFELRSNYLRTLKNWESFYSKENIFVGYYDEIINNPKGLLLRIFKFLEVESNLKHVSNKIEEKINQSPSQDIPLDLELYLAKKFYPQVKELNATLGGAAECWQIEIEQILAKSRFL